VVKYSNINGILIIESSSRYSLWKIFGRISCFSEHRTLHGKIFNHKELRCEYDDNGYYLRYGGYNLNRSIIELFFEQYKTVYKWERWLKNLLSDDIKYIIGVELGNDTLYRHEMSHALFHLIDEYRIDAIGIIKSFYETTDIEYSCELLGMMDYDCKSELYVFDEITAYFSSGNKSTLRCFNTDRRLDEGVFIKEIMKNLNEYLPK